ncbi:MAG TPA: Crp/Fnr family transcriptional regulator, partial [Actinomycetales bacterium]|nr:Crp/Fnr family transcriptional regulator [Actinomycetales bacterium]
ALTVACVLSISADDFRAVMQRHPVVALAVLDDLAHRLEQSRQRVTHLSAGTVDQRVAAALLRLVDVVGEPQGSAILLQLPLTRADLGSMSGTTTESASRVMSRLRQDGVIESGRRWTSVLDVERLRALARG